MFTADTQTTVKLSGNTAGESANIWLWDDTLGSTLFLRGGGVSEEWTSGDIVLAAGHSFKIAVNPSFANGSTEVGTVLNFAVVPAPGAIALLGVAGVVGARRRRA